MEENKGKCFLCGEEADRKEVDYCFKEKRIKGIWIFCCSCKTNYVIADGSIRDHCLNKDETELEKTLSKRVIDKHDKERLVTWIINEMEPVVIDKTNRILNPEGK